MSTRPLDLLTGRVMHERLRPARHRFEYPMCYVRCDIARFDDMTNAWFGIDRARPFSLRRRDYGPRDGSALEPWMRARLADAGIPADGRILLLTIPRVFGYAFNPVSFWFCHDRTGALRALYAEVRNTFGEHRGYLLSAPDRGPIMHDTELTCRKTLHVSPFCDVAGDYVFRVRASGEHVAVAIDYLDGDGLLIRTAIGLRARALNGALAWRTLLAQPFLAINVMPRIHWQALRLWLRRVPFYGKHPPGERHRHDTKTNKANNEEARP